MGILSYAVIGFNTHYPCGEWSLIANYLSFGSPIDLGMGAVLVTTISLMEVLALR